MKRASYKEAVRWIAENDNSGNGDNENQIEEYVTTALIADIFGIDAKKVAKDINRIRWNDSFSA